METMDTNPETKPVDGSTKQSAKHATILNPKIRTLLRRRSVWAIGLLLIICACWLGYQWLFSKAKVLYVTAVVERGNV